MENVEARKFRALNQIVGSFATRDLDLLNTIDRTIDSLSVENEVLNYHLGIVRHEIERVKNVASEIDPNDEVIPLLEGLRDGLGGGYQRLITRRESARHDPRLDENDGVVEAYSALIATVADLHNAINDLCWAIGEHDADLSPVMPGSFDNVEDLLKAMGV